MEEAEEYCNESKSSRKRPAPSEKLSPSKRKSVDVDLPPVKFNQPPPEPEPAHLFCSRDSKYDSTKACAKLLGRCEAPGCDICTCPIHDADLLCAGSRQVGTTDVFVCDQHIVRCVFVGELLAFVF